jgi:hypothetical protein
MDTSDKQPFIDHPALVAHPLLAPLLEQSETLAVAQERAQAALKSTRDLKAIQAYGEFLYLTGYPVHPGLSDDAHVYEVNKTVETVKQLALSQWLHLLPQGYAGEVWLHSPSEEERVKRIRQVWQVAVYINYSNALHLNIANRLSIFDGQHWNNELCHWYMQEVGLVPLHCFSFIAEGHDGFLRVITNYQDDLSGSGNFPSRVTIRPHAPTRVVERMYPRCAF